MNDYTEKDKFYLSKLVSCEADELIVNFPPVQNQGDDISCGYFAVMFAYLLTKRIRPEEAVAEKEKLKNQVSRSLQIRKIACFYNS